MTGAIQSSRLNTTRLAQSRVCVFENSTSTTSHVHIPRTRFSHRSCPSLLSQFVIQVVVRLVRLIPRTRVALKHNMKLGTLRLAQKCSRHRAPCHTSHP